MIVERLAELGYAYEPAPLQVLGFHTAVRSGDLVFTSGQVSLLGDRSIRGRVGTDVDVETARTAAEICAFNCLRAFGAVAPIEELGRVVKVLGMVNVADGFDDTARVIDGCSDFLRRVLGDAGGDHARSAVGVVLPAGFAVEVEMVIEVRPTVVEAGAPG
ncbi:MAG: RidA family protein [Acidimicrobiia bacterium]